jgi:hypothetical protein
MSTRDSGYDYDAFDWDDDSQTEDQDSRSKETSSVPETVALRHDAPVKLVTGFSLEEERLFLECGHSAPMRDIEVAQLDVEILGIRIHCWVCYDEQMKTAERMMCEWEENH